MIIRDHQNPEALAQFLNFLPTSMYCTDELASGLVIRSRKVAIAKKYIQLNPPWQYRWMMYDIDRQDAWSVHDDENLPQPTFIVFNKFNGHAHAAYLLQTPVYRSGAARIKPLRYFAAVERGLRRRLSADPHYSGLLVKNPFHKDWRAEFRASRPFDLDELQSWLTKSDMAYENSPQFEVGAGRNVSLFDQVRSYACRDVLKFRETHAEVDKWTDHLREVAQKFNLEFSAPLPRSEVRSVARSVSQWTWRQFSEGKFKWIQSHRGRISVLKRRERGTLEASKPWDADGISRATYYRRKRKLKEAGKA